VDFVKKSEGAVTNGKKGAKVDKRGDIQIFAF
jgi:hypothetical protein